MTIHTCSKKKKVDVDLSLRNIRLLCENTNAKNNSLINILTNESDDKKVPRV